MSTLAELQAQLDGIDRAIASGTLTVKHGDTMHTARSMAELLQARAHILGQMGRRGIRTIRVQTRSGY
jgi:hypothetical protein